MVPRARLLVAANRDEFFARPAEGPGLRATASGTLLAPRDALAGGTWFGLNRFGVLAALTNVACPTPDPARRSRGLLVVDVLAARSAKRAAEKIRSLPVAAYNPFNLFVADVAEAFAFGYEDAVRDVPNASGIFLIGNAPLDGAEPPKLAGLRERVEAARAEPAEGWLPRLGDWCRDHASAGPRGPLDALCVHTPTYGTRSSCLLQLAEGGLEDSSSVFRFADGAPCEERYEEFTPLLHDLGRGRSGACGAQARSHR
ncbi:MAG: NRDE family protein [Deltaproteobacteria bacterium]|nr:NRDE family protein [Deltaproteobacteria bacterium]